ncbi:hypothetical protein DAPPUDRAFT_335302 [Daphnia pulex]|uniref:Caspase family p20 domain-containing protein n=1 Tax=Daphnia pulex TaxID=6669 RepID=E9HXD5_DAPPU|nr:hypothetical protein DAPPUDRAFT_335302 [Daphnia pulex]|eukprot:EFX63597.1 hypothetical protein DAPPUDRAFT_335302 [Daphnia pulex]
MLQEENWQLLPPIQGLIPRPEQKKNIAMVQEENRQQAEGSEKYDNALKFTFISLGATVELQKDLTYDQETKKIDRLQDIDWNLFDDLVIAIVSHGRLGKFLTADSGEKEINDICSEFSGQKIPRAVMETNHFFLYVWQRERLSKTVMYTMAQPFHRLLLPNHQIVAG